jgi:hypothetical protein
MTKTLRGESVLAAFIANADDPDQIDHWIDVKFAGTEAFVTFSHKPGIIFHYEVPWGDDPVARKLFVGNLNRGLQGVFQNLADHLGRCADEASV